MASPNPSSPAIVDHEAQGVTLKSLLQNPFLLLPKEQEDVKLKGIDEDGNEKQTDKQKEKEKLLDFDYDPFASVDPMSAFLGPKLWDENMLYGDKDLKFEYMDIDEFLNEQGILGSNASKTAEAITAVPEIDSSTTVDEASPTVGDLIDEAAATEQPLPPQEVISMSIETNAATSTVTDSIQTPSLPTPPRTPSPVVVTVDFEVSTTDVALATIPGQEIYDPRQKQFSEEELKPQPMIKKSRKVFVPEERKDDKYWERRRKNNVAAKRSRDARRVKENQIVLRAAYLQKENGVLREEVLGLKKENMSLKSVVEKLQKQLEEATQQ